MVFTFLEKLIQPMDSLIKLGSEYIVDKDKVIEFQFKAMELRQQQAVSLLATKTHPFVDALVKLMYAFQIFWRPMVATFAGTEYVTRFAVGYQIPLWRRFSIAPDFSVDLVKRQPIYVYGVALGVGF